MHCNAHWTEGNTNYLIGKVYTNGSSRSSYRCLAYTELSSTPASSAEAGLNRQQRNQHDPDFIDLANQVGQQDTSKTTLQIHISQDEFCRNIDNVIDEQFSFTFTKGLINV